MTKTRHNLLTDPIFEVQTTEDTGIRRATLCDCLASLSQGDDLQLRRLRPHQSHAWHAFTVQLAAIALQRSGESEPWTAAERWCEALLALTDGHEAWCLYVEDLSRPAFMQPPVPEGTLDVLKNTVRQPDLLDVLQLAKNHDVKRAKIDSAEPGHWALVLVSLQTSEGFGGAGNYGIARMNGGLGSRSDISVVTDEPRFVREVGIWLQQRSRLLSSHGYSAGGHALLWLTPWDGAGFSPFSDLDPFFIEVCRRVRLVGGERLSARSGTTKSARVEQSRKGNTGDIWTPVRKKDGAALTMGAQGPSYPRMHDWVFGGDWDRNPTLSPGGAPVVELVARGLVRGQGTTDGYHERRISIPGEIALSFGTPDVRQALGQLSGERIDLVTQFRRKVLRQALLSFLQGGPERGSLKQSDDGPSSFLAAFERDVDDIFFERLFEDYGHDISARAVSFESTIRKLGRHQLERCFDGAPVPAARRLRAIARAESLFGGACRRVLVNLTTFEEAERQQRSAL